MKNKKNKKNNFKRVLSLFMTLVLCMGAFGTLITNVYASETVEGLKKGEFFYAPHTVLNEDLSDYYYYSDSFFDGSAFDYNEHLATMSMILCSASISSQEPDVDYSDKSVNLQDLLIDLDFWDVRVNSWYGVEPQEQSMGVAMAYRIIGEGEDAYTVLAIVPRSAGYQKEWAGNFTVGVEGEHEGFANGRDIVLDFAKDYVTSHAEAFEGEVKVWTMGYSRGAGVTNIVAASLVRDSQTAIGLDLKQENIFAYTFGTPSTVQYSTDEEKAAFAEDYANIWNVHSDYDIVTLAPFRNWNFTYYGKHHEIKVHDATKKQKMLEFLQVTNPTVYELYTAENSSADPDNFAVVICSQGEEGIGFAPAAPEYGIPTNQKDFLESRIEYLVKHLVPDRNTYVNEGYQYALQQVTSLYFGLNTDESEALIGGMSEDILPLLVSYYCYYLLDAAITEENVESIAVAFNESIVYVKQYLQNLTEQMPELVEMEWYKAVIDAVNSEEFVMFSQMIEGATPEELWSYVPTLREEAEDFAISMTANALSNGIEKLFFEDEEEKEELCETLTDEKVTKPLTRFISYLLLGHEDSSKMDAFSLDNKSIVLATTFAYNSGRYMRVHNNEILLSWLRTEDSLYLNNVHVHDYRLFSDDQKHGLRCECGEEIDCTAHVFEEWKVVKEAAIGENGLKTRSCICGHIEYEEIPALKNTGKLVLIISLSVVGVLIVGGAITGIVKSNKKKKNAGKEND